MRLAPVPIAYHLTATETMSVAVLQSRATHPGAEAAACSCFVAYFVVQAIAAWREGGAPAADPRDFVVEHVRGFMDACTPEGGPAVFWSMEDSPEAMVRLHSLLKCAPPSQKEACWCWQQEELPIESTLRARGETYNGYPVDAGYFGSYCMDGLAMALWCIYHTSSFDEAVTRSVNLLGDADSHGSITGQLAGALYGYRSIHPRFLKWLNTWDDHEFAVRALLLHHLGATRTLEKSP